MIKKAVVTVLLVIMTVCVFGCDKKDESKEEYFVYYKNVDNTKLEPLSYSLKNDSIDEIIKEFLNEIKSGDGSTDIINVMPNDVKILDYDLTEGILTLNFNEGYYNLTGTDEVLLRAAVVLTMTQLDEVDFVFFRIEGNDLVNSKGEVIEEMRASDFVDSIGGYTNTYENTTFTLYYANEAGDMLVPYYFNTDFGGDVSKEQFILEKLIMGPDKEGYYSTLSSDINVMSVSVSNGICYVNLSSNFLTENVGVTDEVAIYSIVNSLSEINYVRAVQISVDGNSDVMYHENISLSEQYTRNLDCVKTTD